MATRTEPSQEESDGRDLFDAKSKYDTALRKEQMYEGAYIGLLLAIDLAALAGVAAGNFLWFIPDSSLFTAQRYTLAALAGLLGGLVYGGKWLYHSIAKGLWHQDRRMWRVLSPWMSVGTTVGIWSLMTIGFFPSVSEAESNASFGSLAVPLGAGFVIGYLSDRFLAKMKELTEVLFGTSQKRQGTQLRDRNRPNNNPSEP